MVRINEFHPVFLKGVKDYEAAHAAVDRGIELCRNDSHLALISISKGSIYQLQGEKEKALELFTKVIHHIFFHLECQSLVWTFRF